MVVFPHSKINLGLHVLAARSDGYHDIETCFYPVPWTDILEIIPSSKFTFSHSGISVPGSEEENLCLKAYRLLQADFDLPPVQMHLHKVIPMGAGLGGGSSDAAFTLRLLNTLFELHLNDKQLMGFAAHLGSDCPFFVQDKPMIGKGRGDQLTETSLCLKGYYLVIAKPEIHVSTAEAYAGVSPALRKHSISEIIKRPVADWKKNLTNDFEESIFNKHPQIASIKETLYHSGAVYAAMSGSGAAVFGLFSEEKNLEDRLEGCRYWGGTLN
jgi:4-diphosphocytidyl-2-C-methyl-D-erythritol kinase